MTGRSCGSLRNGSIRIGPWPAPMCAGDLRHWFKNVFAVATASGIACPSAIAEAMAEERMQPVPCVARVSMRGLDSQSDCWPSVQ